MITSVMQLVGTGMQTLGGRYVMHLMSTLWGHLGGTLCVALGEHVCGAHSGSTL